MSRKSVFAAMIICLLVGASDVLAQGLFVTLNGGYSLGNGTQSFGTNRTDLDAQTSSIEGVYGSLGEGAKFGASIGTMFDANFGVEFGFSYWPGNSITTTYKTSTETSSSKWSGSGFVAVPSLVISANMKSINPYLRLGLVVGLMTTKNDMQIVEPNLNRETAIEERRGSAFGYAAGLGVVVPAGGPVDFFTEVALYSVTYSPGEYEVTKYILNGVDQLPTLPTTKIDYKDNYNTSEDHTQMAVRRPFSSIGILAGVRLNL